MKKLTSAIAFLTLAAFFSLTSCERPTSTEIGGTGGNAILKITPQHHGKNIDSCTISIKYNTQDKPTVPYDNEVKCVMENGKPVATFTGLKKGNYYIFGHGWDPSIEQHVEGGIPYTITEEKTIEITVPVTESGH